MKVNSINDNIHGKIVISELEKRLISNQVFNRLHYVRQNSTVYLTFPTNRTMRFEHSLGTMHLAGKMFKYSFLNADNGLRNKYFQKASIELGRLDIEPLKVLIPEENTYIGNTPQGLGDVERNTFVLLYQSVRIAALFHDLGHPPFSHIVENVIKSKYMKFRSYQEGTMGKREEEFFDTIDSFVDKFSSEVNAAKTLKEDGSYTSETINRRISQAYSDIEIHELIGHQLSDLLLSIDYDEYNKFLKAIKRIVLAIYAEETTFFKDLHSIISGEVDADRLDYVNRDSINSGLLPNQLDISRLIKNMKLVEYKDNLEVENEYRFSFHIKTLSIIDSLLIGREKIFTDMNFHHRSTKMAILLSNSLDLLLEYYFEEKFFSDSVLSKVAELWIPLREATVSIDVNDLKKLYRWDDNWLIELLKTAYEELRGNEQENEELFQCLDELLTNEKHYYSVFKNRNCFRELSSEISDKVTDYYAKHKWNEHTEDIKDALKTDRMNGVLSLYKLNIRASFEKEDLFSKLREKLEEDIKAHPTFKGSLFYIRKPKKVERDTGLYNGNGEKLSYRSYSSIPEYLESELGLNTYLFSYVYDKEEIENFKSWCVEEIVSNLVEILDKSIENLSKM